MDTRHIIIDETMSIMIDHEQITINAAREKAGISYSVPIEIGKAFLETAQSDEELIATCRPIARLIKDFDSTLSGLLFGSRSSEEFDQSLILINSAMETTNMFLLALVRERAQCLH
jgi:hypothetical protein